MGSRCVKDNGVEKLNRRKKSQASRVFGSSWLTILAAIFLVMVIAKALFFAYLSTGGSNKKTVMTDFMVLLMQLHLQVAVEQPAHQNNQVNQKKCQLSLQKVP